MVVKENFYLVVGEDFTPSSERVLSDMLAQIQVEAEKVVAENVDTEWYNLTADDLESFNYSVFNMESKTRVAQVTVNLEHRPDDQRRFYCSVNIRDRGTIFVHDIDSKLDWKVYEYTDDQYNTRQSPHYSNLYEFITEHFNITEWEDLELKDVENELALSKMTLQG